MELLLIVLAMALLAVCFGIYVFLGALEDRLADDELALELSRVSNRSS